MGFFFFQAEDGIRDLVRSRGLGDVYKRQAFAGEADLVVAVRREWPLRMALCMGRHVLNEWLGQWEVAINGLESMTRIDLATEKLDNDARKTDELAPEATIREVTETLRGLL